MTREKNAMNQGTETVEMFLPLINNGKGWQSTTSFRVRNSEFGVHI